MKKESKDGKKGGEKRGEGGGLERGKGPLPRPLLTGRALRSDRGSRGEDKTRSRKGLRTKRSRVSQFEKTHIRTLYGLSRSKNGQELKKRG